MSLQNFFQSVKGFWDQESKRRWYVGAGIEPPGSAARLPVDIMALPLQALASGALCLPSLGFSFLVHELCIIIKFAS